MIEQLLQQRVTIHTPLFSIRTHLIASKEEDEPEAPKPEIYCSSCGNPDLTEKDFHRRADGRLYRQCKKCMNAYAKQHRAERKAKCA